MQPHIDPIKKSIYACGGGPHGTSSALFWITLPAPTPSELTEYYLHIYKGGSGVKTFDNVRIVGRFKFIESGVPIKKWLDNMWKGQKKELVAVEIGCSRGFLLGSFSPYFALNGRLVCFEPTPALRRKSYLRNLNTSYEIVPPIFDISYFQPSSVDLFLSSHVIQHMSNPCEFVSQLFKIMKPGGIVFSEVPIHSELDVKRTPKGELNLFFQTPESMMLLFSRSGFEYVKMSTFHSGDTEPAPIGSSKVVRMLFSKPGFFRSLRSPPVHEGPPPPSYPIENYPKISDFKRYVEHIAENGADWRR